MVCLVNTHSHIVSWIWNYFSSCLYLFQFELENPKSNFPLFILSFFLFLQKHLQPLAPQKFKIFRSGFKSTRHTVQAMHQPVYTAFLNTTKTTKRRPGKISVPCIFLIFPFNFLPVRRDCLTQWHERSVSQHSAHLNGTTMDVCLFGRYTPLPSRSGFYACSSSRHSISLHYGQAQFLTDC